MPRVWGIPLDGVYAVSNDVERITMTRDPKSGRVRFNCPHCSHPLPVNDITECDNCHCHLELFVRTRIPPAYTVEATEVEDDGDDE